MKKKRNQEKNKSKTFLLTTLLVGTLSAVASIIQLLLTSNRSPILLFKFISSGYFGKKALFKGDIMVVYGIGFHYLIAGIWVLLFFVIYPKLKLTINRFWIGVAYGMVIWASMYLVVIPLSNTPNVAGNLTQAIISMLICIVTVGIPIVAAQKN